MMGNRLRSGALSLATMVVVLAWAGEAPAQNPLPPRALVRVAADDFAQLREARRAVEERGGIVQGMIPPSLLLVRLDPSADAHLVGTARITAVERGPVETAGSPKTARAIGRSRAERLALQAWNQRLRAKSPAAQRKPLPRELLGVDALEVPAGLPGEEGRSASPAGSSRPDNTNTRYMCGDCVVTIFLTESDGSQEPSTENWTEAEETQVTAEIQEGLSWLADLVNTNYNANLTFIYEWHYREPTKYEPISTGAAFPAGNAAAYEIMERYGYSGSLSGGCAFNADQRRKYGADMAYLMFVADSSNDADGYFNDGYIAYAYLGGPWMVQNYRNDGWGISRMNQVTAHETGHIFGAGDEYAASGASSTQRYGYLSVVNGNAENGGEGHPCLMLNNSLTLCKYTIGQLGLQLPDTTNDGTPDCLQYDAGGTVRRDQLYCSSWSLDDDSQGASNGNGNGQAEAGEIIELFPTLRNDAYVRMEGVVGTISTSSPYVTIIDATAAFGDVDYSGGEAAAIDPFVVAVSPAAAEGTATFTVELATAQDWHFTFSIDVSISGAPADTTPPAVPTGLAVTATGDGSVALSWNANTEPDLSHYNLYRSENEAFGYALIAQPAANTWTDDTARNGRTYYYKVSASDTTGNESAACEPVSATLVDEPPSLSILSPEDGQTYDFDEEIDFSATAEDREDGTLSDEVTWTSSLQGQLGQGGAFSRTLQPGIHLITASVSDSGGNVSSASVTITVEEPDAPPVLSITSPDDGARYTVEDQVLLAAAATDNEDGDLSAAIAWTSSIDGQLGLGGRATVSLSEGTHLITAHVTDSAGQGASRSVTVTVGPAPLKAPAGLRAQPRPVAVRLRWQDTNGDETGYRVERALAQAPSEYAIIASLGPNAVGFKDVGLAEGTYLYRVRAVRGGDAGPACQPVTVRVARRRRINGVKDPHPAKGEWTGAEETENDHAARDLTTQQNEESAETSTDGSGKENLGSALVPPAGGSATPARTVVSVVLPPAGALFTDLQATSGLLAEMNDQFRRLYERMRRSLRRGPS